MNVAAFLSTNSSANRGLTMFWPNKQQLEMEIATQKKKPLKRKFVETPKVKIVNKKLNKKKKQKDSSSSEKEKDEACIFCNDLYSTSTEGWIQCTACKRWAHESCSNVEQEYIFVCDFCLQKTFLYHVLLKINQDIVIARCFT